MNLRNYLFILKANIYAKSKHIYAKSKDIYAKSKQTYPHRAGRLLFNSKSFAF